MPGGDKITVRQLLTHTSGIVSTPGDVNRFFAALLRGRLLPAPLRRQMSTPVNSAADYGMGLFLRTTSCGVRVYGHDGDSVSYQTWSFSTAYARRQVTVALTPDFRGKVDSRVEAYVDDVVCG